MTSEPDGLKIARDRIAQEATDQTGFLDLGRLGLTSLPEELFALRNLRRLNLGAWITDDAGDFRAASADIAANSIGHDIRKLAQLSELSALYLSETNLIDLCFVARLSALQSLSCSGTQVSDLTPLAGLSALQSLYFSGPQVSDLTPLAGLSALQSLDCSGCRLSSAPGALWRSPSLRTLSLYGAHLPGVPGEVLSQSMGEDCLESLRAHFDDLATGGIVLPDAKLLVLGNGYIGKTQICRRLRNEDYDESELSTHGIVATSARLTAATGEETARLQIWDFGGQDIYHGAHALFVRSRAIFLLVWIPERERTGEEIRDGVRIRDYPLAYWLDYVGHLGAARSPIVIVQTRCDRPEDEAVRPPLPDDVLAKFPFRKIVPYSAKYNRGRPAIDDALTQAVGWLTDEEGMVTIGAVRLRVRRRLEALRDADTKLPVEQRRYRTITQEYFQQLCREEGGVASAKHFLNYLHNAGIAFYHEGLFDDRVVLDQSWAFEAIYAIFHRQKSYKELCRLGGRFTRPLLELVVWQGYKLEEQHLFLSMMQSCGICFVHRRRSDDEDANEYIAPDLLPERGAVEGQIEAMWDRELSSEMAEFEYALLHSGIVRGVISRIGTQAGVTALYWKDGLCAYEKTSGSRVLVEQRMDDLWRGRIIVQTQRGQAAALLERLTALIGEESKRAGSEAVIVTSAPRSHRMAVSEREPASEEAVPIQFTQERRPGREYCVSYAWEAPTQEVVDRLCAAADQRGVRVLRDTTAVGLGESISKFMQRIGRSDRVFIVLSDKYLKSPYCMFELFEIWRNSRADPALFVQRIRAFTLPSVNISTTLERVKHAIYWKEQYEALQRLVQPHGLGILGEADLKQFKLMQDFAHHVSEYPGDRRRHLTAAQLRSTRKALARRSRRVAT